MNFALLAPFGLAALAALALPILIHLIRRLELTTTDFAALRWISERVNPSRRLRFERPWLLVLRLFLLAALALLLAHPVMTEPAAPARAWVVVAPGADRAAARTAVSATSAEWHWLAPAFPPMDTDPPSAAIPLASLLRQLDADLPAGSALSVIVPDELAGLDGERIRLGRKIDWHVVPGSMAAAPTAPSPPIRLAVRYAARDALSLVYLSAAVAAWNAREPGRYTLDAQPPSVPMDSDEPWLVWLGAEPTAAQGEVLWRDSGGNAVATRETIGRGRAIALAGAMTPQTLPMLLDADFPERLLALLRGVPLAPTRAQASAVQPQEDSAAVASEAAASRIRASARPLDPWLVLLIAALFLVERIVATAVRTESDA
jgi:hypothetical protein